MKFKTKMTNLGERRMPFKAVQAAKCPKCGKSVYANEERLAGVKYWIEVYFFKAAQT